MRAGWAPQAWGAGLAGSGCGGFAGLGLDGEADADGRREYGDAGDDGIGFHESTGLLADRGNRLHFVFCFLSLFILENYACNDVTVTNTSIADTQNLSTPILKHL